MKRVLRRKHRIKSDDANDKVNTGFQESRTRAKCLARNYILEKRREKDAHPMYEMILQTEMMRLARFRDIINLPAPYNESKERMDTYVNIFKEEPTW